MLAIYVRLMLLVMNCKLDMHQSSAVLSGYCNRDDDSALGDDDDDGAGGDDGPVVVMTEEMVRWHDAVCQPPQFRPSSFSGWAIGRRRWWLTPPRLFLRLRTACPRLRSYRWQLLKDLLLITLFYPLCLKLFFTIEGL